MKDFLESRIEGDINAKEVQIGKGVVVEKGVVITGNDGPAEKVRLGDFSFIGHDTKVITPYFSLGDYSKLHMHGFCHGTRPLQIGRNCWIGGNVVLDSQGGLDIDDNVGIGAQSQLWTHIQFGDVVEGCRFQSRQYMNVGKDAWFVGHCIVSPVHVGEKSMALVGSVVTRNMEANHVYAGVPAKDITERTGPQFEVRTLEAKEERLNRLIHEFVDKYPQYRGKLQITRSPVDTDNDVTYFDLQTRTYSRKTLEAEVMFLKAYMPLVKFTPMGAPPFVVQNPLGIENDQLQ